MPLSEKQGLKFRVEQYAQTYKATLQGNQLQWNWDAPDLRDDVAVEIYVTVLTDDHSNVDKVIQGKKMAEALEQLAKTYAS